MNLKKWLAIIPYFFIFITGTIVSEDPIKTVWSISSFGKDDYFYEPSDIEVDPHRSLIYIADSGNNRVLVFDFQGEWLKIIGSKGQGPAEFSNPTGLYILEDGGLAVADVGNTRIQIFDTDGKFVQSISTKGAQVADLIFKDNKIYTISTFGSSDYSLDMRSEKGTQPLINALDNQGNLVQAISVDDFPETHPFLRAIKHRVCLALSKEGHLYVPHFAINVIHIFDLAGKKIGQFDRPLPFKPGAPKIIRQTSEEGVIRMQATFDFITQDAKIGPDGSLYLLTFIESYMDRAKRKDKGMDLPPHPERIDVIDTKTHEVIRHIGIDGDTKAFALMNENHIAYVYVDNKGEVILKCIQY
jgi:DNA-binding beta-propeller fold protein YncE